MATDPTIIKALENRLDLLELEREVGFTAIALAEVGLDAGNDAVDLAIKTGKTQEAQALEVELQTARQKLNGAISSYQSLQNEIDDVKIQIALNTGKLSSDTQQLLGPTNTAAVERLLTTDPSTFALVYRDLSSRQTERVLADLQKKLATTDFGDINVKANPNDPSTWIDLNEQGLQEFKTWAVEAGKQYNNEITKDATDAIAKYSNSFRAPAVAQSTPQTPTVEETSLSSTLDVIPSPQSNASDPQVPVAPSLPSLSTIDTSPAPVSAAADPQIPTTTSTQSTAENNATIAPTLDPLVQNQESLKQQQDRQLEEITNRLATGIGVDPSEVADLSLPEIQEAVRRLDNAKLSQFTDNTLVVPSDAELARREAVLSIQQVQAEINRLKDLPVGQTPAVAAEIAAAERRLGNSLQQVQRASPAQVQQASITGKETAILTAGAFLASGLLQALKNNNRSNPAPVSPAQNPTVPPPSTAPDAIPLSSVRTEPNNNFVFGPDGELLPADSEQAQSIINEQQIQERVQNTRAQDIGGDFTEVYDVETGKFNVVNLANNEVVDSGLTQQEAILRAQERSVGDPGYGLDADPAGGDFNVPSQATIRAADFTARSVNAQAMLDQARQQSILAQQRKANGAAVGDGDWRVRLRLAPNATYLYKTPGVGTAGILEPLRNTDGVIFPYTPRIDTSYSAEYAPYDLTHNNYRGYFYKGSRVGEVVLTADFTAQDTQEANYMLAVIHFFKSCTKMFYGQEAERGSPPPLVYLTGLGEFQFNEHACVISNFNYNLPPDVDYIRARSTMASSSSVTQGGNGLMWQRSLAPSATASYNLSSIWSRLTGANIPQGAINYPPPPPNLGQNSPTYVPTKMQMSLTLLPIQSRQQVSQQFSLKAYANGNLLKGGFW